MGDGHQDFTLLAQQVMNIITGSSDISIDHPTHEGRDDYPYLYSTYSSPECMAIKRDLYFKMSPPARKIVDLVLFSSDVETPGERKRTTKTRITKKMVADGWNIRIVKRSLEEVRIFLHHLANMI